VFDDSVITWDGSESTDWNTAANWNFNQVPLSTHAVIIPDVTNDPVLASNVTIASITIQSGGKLTLSKKSLTVSSDVYLYGELTCSGTDQITVGQNWYNYAGSSFTCAQSTVTFSGVNGEFNILSSGNTFYNIHFNQGNSTWTLSDALAADNDITLSTGTIEVGASANSITVASTFTITGGALQGTSCDMDINATNIVHSSGTIRNSGSGHLYLDGTGNYDLYTITLNINYTVSIGQSIQPDQVTFNDALQGNIRAYVNNGIIINDTLHGESLLYLIADYDTDKNGTILWGPSGSATYENWASCGYGEADDINYSEITAKITGCETGGLIISCSSGTVTIDQATTGRTGNVLITAYEDIIINNDIGTSGYVQFNADYDQDGNGRIDQAAGTTITSSSTSNGILLVTSGSNNYLNNINGKKLDLRGYVGSPTYTLRDNATVNLDYDAAQTGMKIWSGITLNAGTGTEIVCQGLWDNKGTFNGNGSTVTLRSTKTGQTIRMASGSFNNLVFDSTGTWSQLNDLTATGNLIISSGTLQTNEYDLAVSSDIALYGELTVSNTEQIDIGGSWYNYAGSTFTAASSTVTFTAATAGQEILLNSASFYNLVFDSSDGNGEWTLQDDLTCSNYKLIDGVFNDGGQILTINGDIILADTADILTSTGLWIQGADGALENTHYTNIINTLEISDNITSTVINIVRIHKLKLGANATCGLAVISANADDFIDMGPGSSLPSGVCVYPVDSATLKQKSINIPAGIDIEAGYSSAIKMTGDWTTGNLWIYGDTFTSNSESESQVLDTNGNNLTVNGYLALGRDNVNNAGYGKIIFSTGTHAISGNMYVNQVTWGYFDLGS
ncbi:MAG: hypothetical protein JRJ85_21685, partial [Deltaproteobacteria bacterium]|nr:hypothetical protein [Deltaproteobacteria bacterium]